MAAEVAVVGRRRRNMAGGSGDFLSGSRGWRPWMVAAGEARVSHGGMAWCSPCPRRIYDGDLIYRLVRIRDGDERAGSISVALAAWRGGVGALLLGSSGGTLRQWPMRQGSYGGTAVAVGRRI
uniref:Uncharacterized protein n=1 Tax=Aegilops tauschii TaxID=37682 RepID=M8BYX4_AEGTA